MHGHDSAGCCVACHELDDIFSENEEDERQSQAEFRRGIKGVYMLTGDREEAAAAAAKELALLKRTARIE